MKKNKKGFLIALEGCDGSGKTTQTNHLIDALRKRGYIVSSFREPGGTDLGEDMRNLLLEKYDDLDPYEQMCLFLSSRARLFRKEIKPLIENGGIVVMDRSMLSTIVYQGFSLDDYKNNHDSLFEFMRQNWIHASRKVIHDLIFVLQVDPKTSRQRAVDTKNGAEVNHFDEATVEKYETREYRYEYVSDMLRRDNNWQPFEEIVDIDGNRSIEEIHEELLQKTLAIIEK